MKKLMKEQTLRGLLGVSATTLWRMRKNKKVPPSISICGRRMYDEEDIRNWIESLKKSPDTGMD